MVGHGKGNAAGLAAGFKFKLDQYPRKDLNIEYLVTGTRHLITSDAGAAGAADPGTECSVSVDTIDARAMFRPARVTPKPIVQGAQTAIVVGPGGEEIYTDEHGRVKLQFHWDRLGKNDENSSCWVRVSHPWAGKEWGAIHIPRIGQEVIVDFLEGDPDKPMITGRVYNGANMPPYKLPANMTQSGVKSRSSKGGSPENFNEIRFEDKKGEELLFVHAEKDQTIEVENDENHSVGHDKTYTVGHDRKKDVGNDETVSVKRDRTETVGGNEKISVGKSRTENVGDDEKIGIGKEQSITVGTSRTLSVTKNQSTTIGDNRKQQIGKEEEVQIGKNRKQNVGENDQLQVGKKLVITAGDEISLTTGSASVTLKKDGTITIKGKDITIEGSGKINVKASSDITMKGSKILQN
jgi:type VI secretion system secreted protein VgrG